MIAPPLLRVAQLARFWEKNPQTIIGWIRVGRLAAIRSPGGHFRVRIADVRAFCEREGMPVPPLVARPSKRVVIAQGLGRMPRVTGLELEVCEGPYAALVTAVAQRASVLVIPATARSFDAEPAVRALRRDQSLRDLAVVVVGAAGRARIARLVRAGATHVVPRGRVRDLADWLRSLVA